MRQVGRPRRAGLAARRPAGATVRYGERKLTEGYPDIETLGTQYFLDHQPTTTDVRRTIWRIGRLIHLPADARVLVIGCGPKPETMRELATAGYRALGVEGVERYADAAASYLGDSAVVRHGMAERLPVEDESQHVVIMESLLEHVDSAHTSVAEAFRVLRPGGVLYVSTTNRWLLRRDSGEFSVPFYQWFPAIVKESYVFRHLHYDPTLARYTLRPAVHWFTYPELCALGRSAGFATFYSFLDLIDETTDPSVASHPAKRWMVRNARERPWLRSLLLTQLGGTVFMHKRPAEDRSRGE
jgi:SAM-dependent methyltransferase